MTQPNIIPIFDIETFSRAGLKQDKAGKWKSIVSKESGLSAVGATRYATDDSTEILCVGYDMRDGQGVKLWIPGMTDSPEVLLSHIKKGGTLGAHNAFFDYSIWNNHLIWRYNWPVIKLEQLSCTQARANAYGLPSSLKDITNILNSEEKKDKKGKELIQLLSIPQKNRVNKYRISEKPQEYGEMYNYCMQDVKATAAISDVLPMLSPTEQKLWELNCQMNRVGVHVDKKAIEGCIEVYEIIRDKVTNQIIDLTDGEITTPHQHQRIRNFLAREGINTEDLTANTVQRLLKESSLPLKARKILEFRQIMGLASVQKLYRLRARLDENSNYDRVHDGYIYHGADTGRYTGAAFQPHNIPREGPPVFRTSNNQYHDDPSKNDPAVKWSPEIVDYILTNTRELLNWKYPLKAISGSLRGIFTAAPNCELIASDYSSIEAIVLAALAGEEWRLKLFREGGDIYKTTGAQITGVPVKEITKNHPARMLGKIAELASGYSGWTGAWKKFGAPDTMTDEEIKNAILKWREQSPHIEEFWGGQVRKDPDSWNFTPEYYGIEGAAILAMLYPNTKQQCRTITFEYQERNNVLLCTLPSGRNLVYYSPYLITVPERRSGISVYELHFLKRKRGGGWEDTDTYGGKLVENITQATARDIFVLGLLRLEKCGYNVVLHTHDEICAEVQRGKGSIKEVEKLMTMKESWYKDWPIKVSGSWRGKRYRK